MIGHRRNILGQWVLRTQNLKALAKYFNNSYHKYKVKQAIEKMNDELGLYSFSVLIMYVYASPDFLSYMREVKIEKSTKLRLYPEAVSIEGAGLFDYSTIFSITNTDTEEMYFGELDFMTKDNDIYKDSLFLLKCKLLIASNINNKNEIDIK